MAAKGRENKQGGEAEMPQRHSVGTIIYVPPYSTYTETTAPTQTQIGSKGG